MVESEPLFSQSVYSIWPGSQASVTYRKSGIALGFHPFVKVGSQTIHLLNSCCETYNVGALLPHLKETRCINCSQVGPAQPTMTFHYLKESNDWVGSASDRATMEAKIHGNVLWGSLWLSMAVGPIFQLAREAQLYRTRSSNDERLNLDFQAQIAWLESRGVRSCLT